MIQKQRFCLDDFFKAVFKYYLTFYILHYGCKIWNVYNIKVKLKMYRSSEGTLKMKNRKKN